MPASKYTAEVLAPLVRESRSLSDVIRKLGLEPNGGNHRHISRCVRVANLDTSHFKYGRSRFAHLTRDVLDPLVRESSSVAEVLRRLALPTDGRPSSDLKAHLHALGIDTSHFRGRGWTRGQSERTHPSVASIARTLRRPDDEVFISNSPVFSSRSLTRRLLARGWPYRCAGCGIAEWRGQPLVLHLDHINGINNDNRIENLRFLCPNCHSQTPTYCNRAREGTVLYVVPTRERGAIGTRGRFRSCWTKVRGGSSPPARTTKIDLSA